MRFNKKKFIYLISPLKINNSFYGDLIKILKKNRVSFFQLRLKKESFKKKIKKIRKICKNSMQIFTMMILAKKLNADGCHLGQKT